MRYGDNRTGIVLRLDDDIDLAFAQRSFKFCQQANLPGKKLIPGSGGRANQKIDVSSALAVVDTGTEQRDCGIVSEMLGNRCFDHGNLFWTKAHWAMIA
jgi:hypothetical protein